MNADRVKADILRKVHHLFPRTFLTLILAICFVCPIVEMFDYWDHTIQTGSDTEYALVVLALCVGVAYSFARIIKQALALCISAFASLSSPQSVSRQPHLSLTSRLFDVVTPPPLEIRI